MHTIYLDYAAATPLDQAVHDAMRPYFSDHFYNPSASYQSARGVRKDIDEARAVIAKALGVRPVELIFTAGGTEANNLAIQGIMKLYPGARVLVSAIEHDSVLEPASLFNMAYIPVNSKGVVDPDVLKRLIDDETVLVSVLFANNEIGVVQHMSALSSAIETARNQRTASGNNLPLYFHSDAAQALNYLKVQPHRLGIDLLSLNGGKIYGPKQSGLLYVRTGVEIDPLIYGGGQERGKRSGTENVPAIMGLSHAIATAVERRTEDEKHMEQLRRLFIDQLQEQLPKVSLTEVGETHLPNIVHISFPGWDNERLMMELDERGIQCAVGSACSASSDEPSHVLKAVGFSSEQAQSSLRFSMGRSTTAEDVRVVVSVLKEILGV